MRTRRENLTDESTKLRATVNAELDADVLSLSVGPARFSPNTQ